MRKFQLFNGVLVCRFRNVKLSSSVGKNRNNHRILILHRPDIVSKLWRRQNFNLLSIVLSGELYIQKV